MDHAHVSSPSPSPGCFLGKDQEISFPFCQVKNFKAAVHACDLVLDGESQESRRHKAWLRRAQANLGRGIAFGPGVGELCEVFGGVIDGGNILYKRIQRLCININDIILYMYIRLYI